MASFKGPTSPSNKPAQPSTVKWLLHERCRIEHAQVNAIDTTFFREQTDEQLFRQDLSVAAFLDWPPPVTQLESETNSTITTLDRYADAIDALFARYGPQACAIKQQSAYWRPQSFADVSDDIHRVKSSVPNRRERVLSKPFEDMATS